MSKILKNTTLLEIELIALGTSIDASSELLINVDDYILLATDDSITELTPLITSGDIIVNDGISDLIISVGIAYIKYPDLAQNILFDNTGTNISGDTVQEALVNISKKDLHSGYNCIPVDESIEIEHNKQSITHHLLKQGGFIKHSGFLRRN